MDPPWELAIRGRLANLLEGPLERRDAAARQYERIVALDRGHVPALERLAELSAATAPDKAIEYHRALLATEPRRLTSYRALRQLFLTVGDEDAAFVTEALLEAVGVADEEEAYFYRQRRARSAAPSTARSPKTSARCSRPRRRRRRSRSCTRSARRWRRCSPSTWPATASPGEDAVIDGGMQTTARAVARLFGVDGYKLYAVPNRIGPCVEPGTPPALFVPRNLADAIPREQQGVLGELMARISFDTFLADPRRLSPTSPALLEQLLWAACELSVPGCESPLRGRPVYEDIKRRLDKAAPARSEMGIAASLLLADGDSIGGEQILVGDEPRRHPRGDADVAEIPLPPSPISSRIAAPAAARASKRCRRRSSTCCPSSSRAATSPSANASASECTHDGGRRPSRCPHCRRQYAMKIDPERLQRLKTRATCGRCGKTFDAASRILAAQQQAPVEPKRPPTTPVSETKRTDPKLPQVQATLRRQEAQRHDLARPARRDGGAGARVRRSRRALHAGRHQAFDRRHRRPASAARRSRSAIAAAGDAPDSPSRSRPRPASIHASVAATASAAIAAATAASAVEPSLGAEVAAGLDQLSLDAEPAGEEEFAAAVPTLSRAAAAPRSWLELSDPGLAALQSPPAAGAAALESLLHEGESIALPPPPTAS